MLAFFAARDPFSRWFQRRPDAAGLLKRVADAAKFLLDEVHAAGAAAATTLLPGVLWDQSASKIGDAAHSIVIKILGHEPTSMAPEHFFAAYCFGEVGHEQEFAAWRFDRTEWTRWLLAWVAVQRMDELGAWVRAAGLPPVIAVPWIRGTNWNSKSERDVDGVMDALVTASDSPFAEFVRARGWKIANPSPRGPEVRSEIEVSPELERWTSLAQVMAFPAPEITHSGVLAAAMVAPPDALPSVPAWSTREVSASRSRPSKSGSGLSRRIGRWSQRGRRSGTSGPRATRLDYPGSTTTRHVAVSIGWRSSARSQRWRSSSLPTRTMGSLRHCRWACSATGAAARRSSWTCLSGKSIC
jgi:hypothetical protein